MKSGGRQPAKKKQPTGGDRSPRRLEMSPDDIRAIAERLRKIADIYDELATEIKDEHVFDKVPVDGASKFTRAMALLHVFKGKIEMGISNKKADSETL